MTSNEEENPFAIDPERMNESGGSDPADSDGPGSFEPDEPKASEDELIDLEELREEPDSPPVGKEIPPEPKKAGKDIPVGVPLEDDDPRKRSVKDLDVCPNCGEPMRDSKTLVCMRCGFDMKTMTVVKTEVGEIDEEEAAGEKPPLCAAGRGDFWLPGAAALISTLVLLIGYLIGYDGLFPPLPETAAAVAETAAETAGGETAAEAAEPAAAYSLPFSTRMTALVRFVAITIFWTGCGLASLMALSRLTQRPFGDVKLGLVRTAAIMTTMALVALIGFDDEYYFAEQAVEVVLRVALAFSVAMLLFSLNPRETATAGGTTVILAIVLYWGAWLITL